MPKMKTHKGLKKRMRVTRNGKVIRYLPGRRKLMSHKSGNRKRRLRGTKDVYKPFAKAIARLLGPGL